MIGISLRGVCTQYGASKFFYWDDYLECQKNDRMTVDQTKGHFFRRILLLFQYIEMKVDKQLTSSRSLHPNPLPLISSN